MAPGLRPFLAVLVLGLGFSAWWMSGQYRSAPAPGGEAKGPLTVWSADAPTGKFWGNEKRRVIDLDGPGVGGTGKAITIRFEGEGWRGCGLNWKGWYPPEAGDDVSRFRSLVFHVRQVTNVADADLTVHLADNQKRSDKSPGSNGLSVLKDGRLSRVDGEWRRVVLPLEKFSKYKDLDLTRVWGVDFSDSSGRPLTFQIDRVGFSDDLPPFPRFPPAGGYAATATVDASRPGHTIRDEIYGVVELPKDKLAGYGIPVVRWGGNRSSRYNWKLNVDNAGNDWFFKNGGRVVADPADGGWVRFAKTNQSVGAASYLTVPMLGFVSKDGHSYAFSVKKYGPQSSTEMGHPDVGNGVRPDGTRVADNDWRDTSVESTPQFIADGVRAVAGHASARYWVLDNEPMLWHETHRDVRPKPLGYDELWDRTVRYAEAIRKADPSAKIAGFCSWGWMDLFYSAADEGGDRYRTQPDYKAHGETPLAEWFIKRCGDYKREHGKPLVDVFDFHWYPQAQLDGRTPFLGAGMDPKFNQLRLRTTRDLWDPDYAPESWVKDTRDGKATMLLRRVRAWVEKHNPGMEVCVGEYNFGGADNISGALAQADVFGILARERADLAFIWTRPEGTQELAWGLFRNYDGRGGRFGDRLLPAESNHANLGVYAAKRSKDGAITVVVLNKDLGGACKVEVDLAGVRGRARVWRFDQETGGKVIEAAPESQTVEGKLTLTVPPASGTMVVID